MGLQARSDRAAALRIGVIPDSICALENPAVFACSFTTEHVPGNGVAANTIGMATHLTEAYATKEFSLVYR